MALARDNQGNIAQVIQPGTSQVVSFTSSSAQSSAITGDKKRIVRLWASQDCWIKLGTNPTAEKETADSHPITAKVDTYFAVPVNYKIAVIRDSADGKLTISYDD